MRFLDVNLHGFLFNLHGLAFLVAFRCKQVHEEKQKHQSFLIWNQTQFSDLGENSEAGVSSSLEEDGTLEGSWKNYWFNPLGFLKK